MTDPLLTVNEVAEQLNCTPTYVRQLLMLGRIPKIKLGPNRNNAVRIAQSDLDAFIAQGREDGKVNRPA